MSKLHSLMLTYDDWANTGFRFNKCLRMLGLDALMLKGAVHPFMYPEQATVHPELAGYKPQGEFQIPSVKELTENAEVLHFIASTFVASGADILNKKIVVQHGGTTYRQKHKEVNEFFNPIADATIIQCPDLLGLGAKNEHLIYYPVDTDWIKPDYEPRADVPIIGHFPSNPEVKGTALIIEAMEELEKKGLKFHFQCDTKRVSWTQNLKRMAECDIIIETCAPEQKGKKYGEWGNTALEAAALGKVVVTNSLSGNVYKKEYGDCNLLIANSKEELKGSINRACNTSHGLLDARKKMSREWAVKNHSMQATAKRLWERVYSQLLPDVKVRDNLIQVSHIEGNITMEVNTCI